MLICNHMQTAILLQLCQVLACSVKLPHLNKCRASTIRVSIPLGVLGLLYVFACREGSNVVSVAEHVVMLILSLVRNYLPAHKQIVDGGWDIGQAAEKAYDLQNKVVGCVGTGRIGQLVLERLKVSVLIHLVCLF